MTSSLTRTFWFFWKALDVQLPRPVAEYRFAAYAVGGPGRGVKKRLLRAGLKDWRLDFAWIDQQVALELEGGVYTRGRHVRPIGYTRDCEKYNKAQELGWLVLRYTTDMLTDQPDEVFAQIKRVLEQRS